MKLIQRILPNALTFLFSYLYEFAFEYSNPSKAIARKVSFKLFRGDCLKVSCSNETGLFKGVQLSPKEIKPYLWVLKKSGFIISYKELSDDTFEVVLPRNPISIAA